MSSIKNQRQHSIGGDHRFLIIYLVTVLTVSLHTSHAQSVIQKIRPNPYLWSINSNSDPNTNELNHSRNIYRVEYNDLPSTNSHIFNLTETYKKSVADKQGNSTFVWYTKSHRELPTELSQTTMDVITIIWYVATFLALAAFFLLMACSDRRCADTPQTGNIVPESPIPPPTPTPSYSEFAPPSYDTVMKMQHAAKTTIFVIPFGVDVAKDNSSSNNNNIISNINSSSNNNSSSNINSSHVTSQPSTPTTPIINFYTINELQKLGS